MSDGFKNGVLNTALTGVLTANGDGNNATASSVTQNAVIIGAASNLLSSIPLNNGQVVIGATAGAPLAATLTAGTGISITNGANSITIASSGGGVSWSSQTTNFNAAVNNGYFIAGNAVATLPASPSNGDAIAFFVDGAFTVTITANTGQTIQISSNVSSSAGTQANTATGDACTLVYRSTDTKWCAVSFVGAWNKT